MSKALIYLLVGAGSLVVYSILFSVLYLADAMNHDVIVVRLWIWFVTGTTIVLGSYLAKRYGKKGS